MKNFIVVCGSYPKKYEKHTQGSMSDIPLEVCESSSNNTEISYRKPRRISAERREQIKEQISQLNWQIAVTDYEGRVYQFPFPAPLIAYEVSSSLG